MLECVVGAVAALQGEEIMARTVEPQYELSHLRRLS